MILFSIFLPFDTTQLAYHPISVIYVAVSLTSVTWLLIIVCDFGELKRGKQRADDNEASGSSSWS